MCECQNQIENVNMPFIISQLCITNIFYLDNSRSKHSNTETFTTAYSSNPPNRRPQKWVLHHNNAPSQQFGGGGKIGRKSVNIHRTCLIFDSLSQDIHKQCKVRSERTFGK